MLCQNSIALNINFNIKRGFQNIKICRNFKIQGIWTELRINQCFFRQFWIKYSRQILEFTLKDLSVKSFKADFLHFLVRLPKLLFCVTSWSLAFDSKSFQRFSWNFLISEDRKSWLVRQLVRKFPHSLSPDNNLVLFHLCWRKTMPNVKKSPNILSKTSYATKAVVNLWYQQNYVILIKLFSKEILLFDVKVFICLDKMQFLLGKEVALFKRKKQVNHKK